MLSKYAAIGQWETWRCAVYGSYTLNMITLRNNTEFWNKITRHPHPFKAHPFIYPCWWWDGWIKMKAAALPWQPFHQHTINNYCKTRRNRRNRRKRRKPRLFHQSPLALALPCASLLVLSGSSFLFRTFHGTKESNAQYSHMVEQYRTSRYLGTDLFTFSDSGGLAFTRQF